MKEFKFNECGVCINPNTPINYTDKINMKKNFVSLEENDDIVRTILNNLFKNGYAEVEGTNGEKKYCGFFEGMLLQVIRISYAILVDKASFTQYRQQPKVVPSWKNKALSAIFQKNVSYKQDHEDYNDTITTTLMVSRDGFDIDFEYKPIIF